MSKKGYLAVIIAFIASMITACDPSHDWDIHPIPADERPAIALISPSNNNILALAGDHAVASFRLSDNEALRVFRVIGQIYDEHDSLIGTEFIVQDEIIMGQKTVQDVNYLVPLLPSYYKVRLTAYAIDTKGAYTSAVVWVNVVPTLPAGPPHPISNEYKSFRLYSKLSGGVNYRFQFSLGASNPPGQPNPNDPADIQEISATAGTFEHRLKSPNNEEDGQSNVFVVLNSSLFNYDLANWNTLSQAFFSAADPTATTAPLNVGDIVVVRLEYIPIQGERFAVMRVTEVVDDPLGDAGDYIGFDYKYTY